MVIRKASSKGFALPAKGLAGSATDFSQDGSQPRHGRAGEPEPGKCAQSKQKHAQALSRQNPFAARSTLDQLVTRPAKAVRAVGRESNKAGSGPATRCLGSPCQATPSYDDHHEGIPAPPGMVVARNAEGEKCSPGNSHDPSSRSVGVARCRPSGLCPAARSSPATSPRNGIDMSDRKARNPTRFRAARRLASEKAASPGTSGTESRSLVIVHPRKPLPSFGAQTARAPACIDHCEKLNRSSGTF